MLRFYGVKMIQNFACANDGLQNARALQCALDTCGHVVIDCPGVYELGDTILLRSGMSIECVPGVILKRVIPSGMKYVGNAFINEGAYTGKCDRDIRLNGFTLDINGVESSLPSPENPKRIPGARGHLCFVYVRNLVIENVRVIGLKAKDYGIGVSDFENVHLEGLYAEGDKDGVHFGPGKGFVLKDSSFRTFDDPIALNASDYSRSNPNLGTIENGLIENCTDLNQEQTTGFFIRLLVGAWTDWEPGMTVRNSDAVVRDGKIYRVYMEPDGKSYISKTPPEFEKGFQVLDGITWIRTNLNGAAPYQAEIRNITFRNLHMNKDRGAGIAVYCNDDDYLHSYREGAEEPVVSGLVFDTVTIDPKIKIREHIQFYSRVSDVTFQNIAEQVRLVIRPQSFLKWKGECSITEQNSPGLCVVRDIHG